ncbi:MAG TPA: hypothetical protein VFE56_08660 [Candidatus Binataceae bacterium]|nr:hypothetical protein [Candidatus Binataceae bacterium]
MSLPCPRADAKELVVNGLLRSGTGNKPQGWEQQAFFPAADAATFKWTPDPSKPGVLVIINLQANDSRWLQTINVSPSTWYRVSGWIRSDDVGTTGGLGAYLDEMDNDYQSDDLRGSKGWQQVKFWMKTGPSQRTALLACRLGGYSALNTGTGYFTGISFMQVRRPPPGQQRVYGCGSWDFDGFTDYCGQTSILLRLVSAIILVGVALLLLLFIASSAGRSPPARANVQRTTNPALTPVAEIIPPEPEPAPDLGAETAADSGLESASGTMSTLLVLFGLALAMVAAYVLFLWRSNALPDPLAIGAAMLAGVGLTLALRMRRAAAGRARVSRFAFLISEERLGFLAVFALFLAFYSVTRGGETPFVEHVHQANAFLHGHSWVEPAGPFEGVTFKGHFNLLHPPLSAIVLMPFVAIWGLATDQQAVSIVIGALNVALAWRLVGLLGLGTSARLWMAAFFGWGTIMWYEAQLGAVWGFCLVLSVAPTLCALNEVFGDARPLVVGAFAALAALARYDLVLVWPVYAALLMVRGRKLRELLWMAPGFAGAAVVYGVFNETRYGTFVDMGMRLWYQYDGAGLKSHPDIPGPFSVRYLPANLYTVLFMGPGFDEKFPYVHPLGNGQALMLTSPAFLLALKPSLWKPVTALMWLATLVGMAAALSVYANGFIQFGARYWIQVYPFLLVLVALGVGKRTDQITKILIISSILILCFATWHIRTMGFG